MAREINDKIDALFVEGPDDGATVNAFVKKLAKIDLARHPYRVVRTLEEGGGDVWALREFERYIATARPGARVGLIAGLRRLPRLVHAALPDVVAAR
jgi:hypothetical protein